VVRPMPKIYVRAISTRLASGMFTPEIRAINPASAYDGASQHK
jgi:hypothetical protein